MQDGLLQNIMLGLLACMLIVAAFTDLRSRRIANWLNASVAIAAPLYWWVSGLTLWPGVAIQVGLAVAVFAVLSVLFAMRMMGGGDVKLLTALALWFPPLPDYVNLLIIMALAGGVLTLVMGAWHVARRQKDRLAIPYGIAIAVGGLCVLGMQYAAASPAKAAILG
jgi:prepilin peptidase CpaA